MSAGHKPLHGGPDADEMFAVIQTPDGGNVLAGYTESSGAGGSDVWLLKIVRKQAIFHGSEHSGMLVPSGTSNMPEIISIPTFTRDMPWVDWSVAYGGSDDDCAKSLIQTSEGDYLLAGYTRSFGAGGSDMYLLKVNSNGTLLWSKTYGGPLDDEANCIIQTGDGGYVLAGYTTCYCGHQSSWVVKTDSSGNIQWSVRCSGEAANSIVQTSDGGYVVATEHSNAFGLVKLNSVGDIEWSETYGGSYDAAESESVVQATDGGYALAGWLFDNDTDGYSAWLIKTDSVGVVLWNQSYADYGVYSIVQTSDGGYAMAGDRACLIITDSCGNVEWLKQYDSLSENMQHIFTRAYSLIQPYPNTFVMPMVQDSYGQVLEGLDSTLVTITLETVNETSNEEVIDDAESVLYSSAPPEVVAEAVEEPEPVTSSPETTEFTAETAQYSSSAFVDETQTSSFIELLIAIVLVATVLGTAILICAVKTKKPNI